MTGLIGALTVALMSFIAYRANRSFAQNENLPLHFDASLSPARYVPRRYALSFMPALAALIFIALVLIAPDTLGSVISAAALLGGQLFYHHLLKRIA